MFDQEMRKPVVLTPEEKISYLERQRDSLVWDLSNSKKAAQVALAIQNRQTAEIAVLQKDKTDLIQSRDGAWQTLTERNRKIETLEEENCRLNLKFHTLKDKVFKAIQE